MKSSRNGIIASIILMVFGIILMIKPADSLLLACTIIGWALIAFGAVAVILLIIRALKADPPIPSGLIALSAFKSIVALAGGILLLVFSEAVVSILPFLFGLLMLILGLSTAIYALLCRNTAPRWVFPLISGILTCIFGILIMLNPFSTATVLVFFMGLSLLIGGLSNLFAAATL